MGSEKEQRIIEAATSVFLRYGFRRTTMGDLAQAAGISRPALYLLFCNKERIFEAAMGRMVRSILDEIQAKAQGPDAPLDKLRHAFELWAVRPYTLIQGSPDARDLIQCDFAFAESLKAEATAAFEAQLTGILAQFPGPRPEGAPTLEQIARVLAASAHGFKESARSVEELQGMLEALLSLTAASLQPSR